VADSLIPASADYTDKDFDSANRRLKEVIASVFPTWTDTSVANFGNIIREMFCFCMDVLGFNLDNQAIESRITTAAQRKNLLALVKLINYEPSTAVAAQCLVRFTCDPAPPGGDNVVLGGVHNPFPVVVRTADGAVPYELQETVTLTSGTSEVWATVENSETHTETFTALGLMGQEITPSRTPYLYGSAVVTAGNGGYTEVESFINSTPTDRHFTVHVTNSDRAVVRFGNLVSGALPAGSIVITYKTGGGSQGNNEPDSISKIDGAFQTNSGLPATIKVLNAEVRATGGFDRESEAQIRENAPLSLRVLTRAVCREDFEILSQKLGGMARALMLTSTEDPDIPANTGHLRMIPAALAGARPGFPTVAKMEGVLTRIRTTYPWLTSFLVQLRMPTFLSISIYAKVFLRKGYSMAQVRLQVDAALLAYFSLINSDGSTNTRVTFGYQYETSASDDAKVVPLSDLQNALRDCVGIQRLGTAEADFTVSAYSDNNTGVYPIRVAGSHADVPILRHEFPRYDAIVLVDGATGTSF
jgi:hypothetical protein